MKVLLVNKFLYLKGGDARSTLSTGELLSLKGHKVIFWGMSHPLNPDYPHSDLFIDNVDFNIKNNLFAKMKLAVNILYSFEAKSKIEKLIKIERPDIVHLNNFAHQISPSILHITNKYKIPTVMTIHDYKLICPTYSLLLNGRPCEKCGQGRYYRCFVNKCSKNSYSKSLLAAIEMYLHHSLMDIYGLMDCFIATTEFARAKMKSMGFKRKTDFLPNFVKVDDFIPSYEITGDYILYFGRLSEEKGLMTLFDAVKNIEDVKLNVVGEGPLKQKLEDKIQKENIKNIFLLGKKTGSDLRHAIKQSIFCVLPSEWYEPFGLTVIEAAAIGKLTIGARIGGIREIISDGETGLLFTMGDVEDLKKKITYLLKNPDKITEMGKNARGFAEKKFDAEDHYKGLMRIYEKAASNYN